MVVRSGERGGAGYFVVIEDERSDAVAAVAALACWGAVVIAETCADARQWLGRREVPVGLIVDQCLPDGDGLRLVMDLRQAGNLTPALITTRLSVLNAQAPRLLVNLAYRASAGFALKPLEAADVAAFVSTCTHPVPRSRRAVVARNAGRWALTPAETTVLTLLVHGLRCDGIAARLARSRHTVQQHLNRIREKSGFSKLDDVADALIDEADGLYDIVVPPPTSAP